MKPKEFGSMLLDFGAALAAAGAGSARDRLALLANAFEASPAAKVADVAMRIRACEPASERTGGPTLGDVAPLISCLGQLLEGRVKATIATDIRAVDAALRVHPSLELNALSRALTEPPTTKAKGSKPRATKATGGALRTELVADYQQKLESSLGDPERFVAVINHLRSNKEVGKPEIAALAKQMTGSAGRSIEDGLKKIMSRHQTLMAFKAKSLATGGRSAA